jgi:hypothetical protein
MVGLGEPREVRAGVVGGSYFDVMGCVRVTACSTCRTTAPAGRTDGAYPPVLDDGTQERCVPTGKPSGSAAPAREWASWSLGPSGRNRNHRQRRHQPASSVGDRRCASIRDGVPASHLARIGRPRRLHPTVYAAMMKDHPEAIPRSGRTDQPYSCAPITRAPGPMLLVLLAASARPVTPSTSPAILARSVPPGNGSRSVRRLAQTLPRYAGRCWPKASCSAGPARRSGY